MLAKATVLLATLFGVDVETDDWPAAGLCSASGPIARVTTGPALCSVGRDSMILAATSPEVKLPAGVASILTSMLENVGLRVTPAIAVGGTIEDSITPPSPIAEVGRLPAFSAAARASLVDVPALRREIVAKGASVAATPISVGVAKLDSAVSPEEPRVDVVEAPATAT